MILDTTFLIDVLSGNVENNDQAQAILTEADTTGKAKVSSITVMELAEGIYLSDTTEREQKRVTELLDGLHEIPFNREMGMLAGELSAILISNGERIEDPDIMIGATALVSDEPIVTRNVDHFQRLEGVEILSY